MSFAASSSSAQRGASNLLYLGLAVMVLALAVVGLLVLKNRANNTTETAAETPSADDEAVLIEQPKIKTVDFQEIKPEPVTKSTSMDKDDGAEDGGLFGRGGKVIPLTDGLAGGTEATTTATETPASRPANAVDAFDYGVLDGRVRIGVFGKGGIPDYKVSIRGTEYLIQMPGDFRYVEDFSRLLNITAFGVKSARLSRDSRGMRMLIEVSETLAHKPFLIEDPQGLIVAFEPR